MDMITIGNVSIINDNVMALFQCKKVIAEADRIVKSIEDYQKTNTA